jgi:hypothetical protein
LDLDDGQGSAGETDRKKIYAGKTAVRSIYRELFRIGKSNKDWLKLIPQVCNRTSEAAALIDEIMMHGAPTGNDEQVMLARCLVQLTEKLNEMDNLTKVGGMAYQDEQYEPFKWFSEEFYLAPFNVKFGVCCGCSGLLRSGKTNWSFKLIEMGLNNDWTIVTNMWFDREKSRVLFPNIDMVHYVRYFTDMIKILSGPGKKLLVMDEISQYFDRKTAMAKENIELEHFLRLMGKMNTQAIFIEQDEDRYPTLFEKFMQVMYFKPSKKQLEYTVVMPELKIHRYVDGVPLTKIAWDTHHPASFFVDVDLVKFNDLLVQMEVFHMSDLAEMVDKFRTSRPGDPVVSSIERETTSTEDPVTVTINRIAEMSDSDKSRFKGPRGKYDWHLIKFEFFLSEPQSRTIAKVLDRDRDLPQGD